MTNEHEPRKILSKYEIFMAKLQLAIDEAGQWAKAQEKASEEGLPGASQVKAYNVSSMVHRLRTEVNLTEANNQTATNPPSSPS